MLCKRVDEYSEDMYLQDIKKGPTVRCISCDRLFFDYSMTLLTYKKLLKKCTLDFLLDTCPYGNFNSDLYYIGYACSNCKKFLYQAKVPPLSLAHEKLSTFSRNTPRVSRFKRDRRKTISTKIWFYSNSRIIHRYSEKIQRSSC